MGDKGEITFAVSSAILRGGFAGIVFHLPIDG